MASHSLPVPVPQARERSQIRVTSRLPLLRVAVAVFATLLILFAWLHLLVAMEIASTNRLIMAQTGKLERLERDKQAVLLKIAWEESPLAMEARLQNEGFVLQEPMYLDLSQASANLADSESTQPALLAESAIPEEKAASESPSLLESIIGGLKSSPETQP